MRSLRLSFQYENPLRKNFPADFFRSIDSSPGIYLMLGSKDSILYIGKAKNLKSRLNDYPQAKPGTAPEHILEMLESVRHIEWHVCESEEAALAKESELLHAIRPPFNIAQTEEEHYLFLGVRDEKPGRVGFRLSRHADVEAEGYAVYGCFRHRAKIKSGYSALMRLLYAGTFDKPRFSYPAKITRASPPWVHAANVPSEWRRPLHEFLSGEDLGLLHRIFETLLHNERIPAFMRPSLQEDLALARQFFELGPRGTRELTLKHGVTDSPLSHARMDQLIERELRALRSRKAG